LLYMNRHIVIIIMLLATHWQLKSQGYSIKEFDLSGDINSWYTAHFDSINTKPLIGAWPSVSPPGANTNNFFFENAQNWTVASMKYDNHVYHNLNIRYDIEKHTAYLQHPLFWQPLIVNQEMVDWFKTPAGTFKPKKDEKGYYLVLFEGKNLSYTKESSKRVIAKEGALEYKRTNDLFLLTEDKKIRVERAKGFLKQFEAHKKDIKQFMRTREIRNIKRDSKEAYLTRIAEYCDNLSTL